MCTTVTIVAIWGADDLLTNAAQLDVRVVILGSAGEHPSNPFRVGDSAPSRGDRLNRLVLRKAVDQLTGARSYGVSSTEPRPQ